MQRTSLGRRLQHALTGGPNRRFPGLHSPPGGVAASTSLLVRTDASPYPYLFSRSSRLLAVGLLGAAARWASPWRKTPRSSSIAEKWHWPGGHLHRRRTRRMAGAIDVVV